MLLIAVLCALLPGLTTITHYEVLRMLSSILPHLDIPSRARLIIVIFATFGSHVVQMLFYGFAFFALIDVLGFGILGHATHVSISTCLYFSAETYTSLGLGDILPSGPVRFLVGAESLNGLLLIGWSASYTYIAMERFWNAGEKG